MDFKIQYLKVKCLKLFFLSCIFIFLLFTFYFRAWATNCPSSDYDCQIAELQTEIEARLPAQQKNKEELSSLRKQVQELDAKIKAILAKLNIFAKEIKTREEEMAYTQAIFEAKAEKYYRFLRLYDPITPFLSSDSAATAFKEIVFRKRSVSEDRKLIDTYAADLKTLKEDKTRLEKNRTSLAALQSKVSEREKFLAAEVAKVESYLNTLSSRQQELIAAKAGGFSTSIGDTPATFEPCSGAPGSSNYCDPGFKPAFAAFSFGAPHRTGMSQYGAYGRAKSGQSAEDILAAYYQGSTLNKSYSSPATIGVTGYGRIAFESNYLLGIHEIPESWGDQGGFEALKAQAVAARTYALAVTANGSGTICATEACQVYKSNLKSGKWAEAVRATAGWVLFKDGAPAKTFYASTSGGFTISQWGWGGIVDVAGGSTGNWPAQAYEKIGGSPWFYKGWYRSRGGATCGRNNPWLTSAEISDIINAAIIIRENRGDLSRVSPQDSCWNGNPYSKEDLAGLGGVTQTSNVSVVYSNSGSTQQVVFSTNKGSLSFSGEEFKKAFNLRAPGYIGIKSSLYNLEQVN